MHPAVYEYKKGLELGAITETTAPVPEKMTDIAKAREQIVIYVQKLRTEISQTHAIKKLLTEIETASTTDAIRFALSTVGKRPSFSSIRLWLTTYEKAGFKSLIPKWSGYQRKNYGWEHKALELYHSPQKPSIRKVARTLQTLYFYNDATESNVWYFFNGLPENLKDKSPWRLGRKQYNDALKEHIQRTTEVLPVGFLYQGDGHCVDVYIKHPRTGNIYRPELVLWMDVKSRYVVGWHMCMDESATNTMAALSHAMSTHNHVPAMVHVDHGSGFKNKMMNEETCGFYESFSITPMFAIPGNAKAKNVERFFRTLRDDFSKNFDTYCGHDMSPDVSRHFDAKKLKKLEADGRLVVPTLEQWQAAFTNWLNDYHSRPHPEYKNTTPEKMWATVEKVPVVDTQRLVRPRTKVNVHRSLVRFHNRTYRNEFLHQYEGKQLIAEYDLHDDSSIRLFDEKLRLLCIAELKTKRDYISKSRIEDAERKRLKGQLKRIEAKKEEARLRSSVDGSLHIEQAKEIEALSKELDALDQETEQQDDYFDFDAVSKQLMEEHEFTENESDDLPLYDIYNR